MRSLFFGLLALSIVSAQASPEVTFASYNIRNYFETERASKDGSQTIKAKPPEEIEAVVRSIKQINPDILGICEMGTKEDFEALGERLKKAGLEFKDSHYVDAQDDRHLALFSRFPIVERHEVGNLTYDLNGQVAHVRRGLLDVTIEISKDYRLRMVGAHLKSKRPVPEGEALIRRHEAELLRKHIEEVLTHDPESNLLVYGDFNDTKNEPPISAIKGRRGAPDYMEDIWVKDTVGDHWTHYWTVADVYSRFDYLFANKALLPEIQKDKSYIFRSDFTLAASDHRPIVTVIDAENK